MGRIVYKRKYTENHPAKNINLNSKIRNKVIEFVAINKKVSKNKLNEFIKELSKSENSAKRWFKSKASLFSISEEGDITLSKNGNKIYNKIMNLNESEETTFLSFEEFSGIKDTEKDEIEDEEVELDKDEEDDEIDKEESSKKDNNSIKESNLNLLNESSLHKDDLDILEARNGIMEGDLNISADISEASNFMFEAFVKFREMLELNKVSGETIETYREIRNLFEEFEKTLNIGNNESI